jgi:S-adenosylmethionine synthetase
LVFRAVLHKIQNQNIMKKQTYLFTSESVSAGHPDKVADQISDAVLDAYLLVDPHAKVACETLICNDKVIIAGEITASVKFDEIAIAKHVLDKIGYNQDGVGFNWKTASFENYINVQSPEIAQSVSDGGAGDQGIMFGYACNETPELLPLPISLANKIVKKLHVLRDTKAIKWLRPDAKSQVTVKYENGKPISIEKIVVSTQHTEGVLQQTIREVVIRDVVEPILREWDANASPEYLINPSGSFTIGGPKGDTGLTGRKIIVDTYGGSAPHGGGAFSGKDPSKVDRSASYAARYIAKHLVAAGIVDRCTVQLSYAIGVAEPTSIYVDGSGTEVVDLNLIQAIVPQLFPVKPNDIIKAFKLKRPIYLQTASYGHFSNEEYPWEIIDETKISGLKGMCGICEGPNHDLPERAQINDKSKACFFNFMEDPEYGHLKFKWLHDLIENNYLPFHTPEGLVQKVRYEEFLKDERTERIPIFLGSQFGLFPAGYKYLLPLNDGALHAIISKSMLSGTVGSLKLNRWNAETESFETLKTW